MFDPSDVMSMSFYEILVVERKFCIRIMLFQVGQERIGSVVKISSEG